MLGRGRKDFPPISCVQVPATYKIELVSDNPESGQPGQRRLLDTEKLVFSTDDAGRPLVSKALKIWVLCSIQSRALFEF